MGEVPRIARDPPVLNNSETLEMLDLSLCVKITFKSIQNLSNRNLTKIALKNVILAYNIDQCENSFEFNRKLYKNTIIRK